MITNFSNKNSFLSNFYVEPDGTTVEHEFQAAKSMNPFTRQWIMQAATPGQAKRRGRKVRLRSDWEEIKDRVMLSLVRKKFLDHPELADKLLNTRPQHLVEGNLWHDDYWGSCVCPNHVLYPGTNRLGDILMRVREEIAEAP